MNLSLPQSIKLTLLSVLLGFGGGVLAGALTTDYLLDYTATLEGRTEPPRLSEERPRSTPQTYADALETVAESVLPGVATFYTVGSYERPFASGAVLTSDGWLLSEWETSIALTSVRVMIGGTLYEVERAETDPDIPGIRFVKVTATNLPVFGFGSGFDLEPGDQLFAAPESDAVFAETLVESRWPPGPQSSDLPQRRMFVASVTLREYVGAPVVNVRGELVGIISASPNLAYAEVLPVDGVLPAFNALLRDGSIVRPALGVVATDLTRTVGLGEDATYGFERGALLQGAASVKRGSAAALAGLVPGDLILSVDGRWVDAYRSLDELIVTHAPGDAVTVRVTDGETERDVRVVLGTL